MSYEFYGMNGKKSVKSAEFKIPAITVNIIRPIETILFRTKNPWLL